MHIIYQLIWFEELQNHFIFLCILQKEVYLKIINYSFLFKNKILLIDSNLNRNLKQIFPFSYLRLII